MSRFRRYLPAIVFPASMNCGCPASAWLGKAGGCCSLAACPKPAPRLSRGLYTLSANRHPSVDHQGVPGQETGAVGGQVQGPARDLARFRVPRHRRLFEDEVEEGVVLQDGAGEVGVDEA